MRYICIPFPLILGVTVVYMVVIPWTITSYCPVHSTPKVVYSKHSYLHAFQHIVLIKNMIDQSTGVEASQAPPHSRISLLLTLVLGSASDSCNNKDNPTRGGVSL